MPQRKQEQLEAKQKVLLYKLQKEQEAAATGIEKRPNSSRSLPQDGSPNDTPSPVRWLLVTPLLSGNKHLL